jgi:prepilin-type N-terminal cleavage/methylation domain-containing protein
MVKFLRNRAGVTLAELLMVVAIIGIIILIVPRLLTQGVRFYLLHNAKIEIQRDARAGLDLVNRFLRQAESSTVVIDQATGQPPYSRIRFTGIDGQNYKFYQQGTNLYQVARSSSVISKNLRYIAFTYPRYDDPSIISVAMTMERATYQGGTKALELSIEKVRVMN